MDIRQRIMEFKSELVSILDRHKAELHGKKKAGQTVRMISFKKNPELGVYTFLLDKEGKVIEGKHLCYSVAHRMVEQRDIKSEKDLTDAVRRLLTHALR